jgi:hypothetical protein
MDHNNNNTSITKKPKIHHDAFNDDDTDKAFMIVYYFGCELRKNHVWAWNASKNKKNTFSVPQSLEVWSQPEFDALGWKCSDWKYLARPSKEDQMRLVNKCDDMNEVRKRLVEFKKKEYHSYIKAARKEDKVVQRPKALWNSSFFTSTGIDEDELVLEF